MGGTDHLRLKWTTFIKSRLNCSLPGEYPFYFDEIKDMVFLESQKILYATFTTSRSELRGPRSPALPPPPLAILSFD